MASYYSFNKPDVALTGSVDARCAAPDALHLEGNLVRSRHEIKKVASTPQTDWLNLGKGSERRSSSLPHLASGL